MNVNRENVISIILHKWAHYNDANDALQASVDAIREMPAGDPCDDAVSRQAGIDIIDSWLSCDDYNEAERHIMRAMQSVLYDMPSVTTMRDATPEEQKSVNDYIKSISTPTGVNFDDVVSRDAVKEIICAEFVDTQDGMSEWRNAVNDVVEEILHKVEHLPSVTQKSGKWIEDAKTYYEELNKRGLGVDEYTPYFTDDIACSECLAKYNTIDNETEFFKYCPNCGARMESEE